MGLEAGWNCHISLQSEHGDEVRPPSHEISRKVSNHPSQCSSAGIEQIEMDAEAQRVRFKEDSSGNVHEDVDTENEKSEDLIPEGVLDVDDEDVTGMESGTSESEALLKDSSSCRADNERDGSELEQMKEENEGPPPEWHPLLEETADQSYLQSQFPNRQRQISETHTCSDGTDVDTTDSVTGGFDMSNRVSFSSFSNCSGNVD